MLFSKKSLFYDNQFPVTYSSAGTYSKLLPTGIYTIIVSGTVAVSGITVTTGTNRVPVYTAKNISIVVSSGGSISITRQHAAATRYQGKLGTRIFIEDEGLLSDSEIEKELNGVL